MNLSKIDAIKTGVSLVASFGVGEIIGNLIKSTTPPGTRLLIKGCIAFGGLVLSCIGGDMVGKYVEDTIDEGVKIFKDVVEVTKESVNSQEDLSYKEYTDKVMNKVMEENSQE